MFEWNKILSVSLSAGDAVLPDIAMETKQKQNPKINETPTLNSQLYYCPSYFFLNSVTFNIKKYKNTAKSGNMAELRMHVLTKAL